MLGQYLTIPSGETAMQDGVWFSLAAKTLTSLASWAKSEGGSVSSRQLAPLPTLEEAPVVAPPDVLR